MKTSKDRGIAMVSLPEIKNISFTGVEDESEISWLDRFSKFTSHVSIVGLVYTNDKSSSFPSRILWSILILFGLCFMIYQIQDRFTAYLKYETTTTIKDRYNPHLQFPAVTICNENRMKKSAVEKKGRYGFNKL